MSYESLTRPRVRRLRLAGAVSAAILALALAACGSDGGDSAQTDGGGDASGPKPVLRIGLSSAPASLDPALDGASWITMVHSLSNEALIQRTPEGELRPGLAESWRYVGEGNRTFELTLREDAMFSDGTPVDAEAVKGWLEYFPRAGGPFANAIQIRSIDTVGRDRVVIYLAAANSIMPILLTESVNWGMVAAPANVARPRSLGSRPIGAGPYKLDTGATIAGDAYVFVPNEHYYDPSQQRWSRVEVKIIEAASSMLQAARSGQLDVTIGDPGTADGAKSAGLEVLHEPSAAVGLVFMDRSGDMSRPLGDERVRQAMNYALDREAITEALVGEYGTPTSEWATLDGSNPDNADHYPYDPEKARELLAEAGYPDGFTVRVLGLGTNTGARHRGPNGQAVAQYLQRVGIDLDLSLSPTFPEFLQRLGTGRYPVIFIERGGDPMSFFYSLYLAPESGLNFTRYRNAELDELWRKAQVSDPEEVDAIWRQMSDEIVDQALFVPDFLVNTIMFVDTDRVANVELTPQNAFIPLPTEWEPAGG